MTREDSIRVRVDVIALFSDEIGSVCGGSPSSLSTPHTLITQKKTNGILKKTTKKNITEKNKNGKNFDFPSTTDNRDGNRDGPVEKKREKRLYDSEVYNIRKDQKFLELFRIWRKRQFTRFAYDFDDKDDAVFRYNGELLDFEKNVGDIVVADSAGSEIPPVFRVEIVREILSPKENFRRAAEARKAAKVGEEKGRQKERQKETEKRNAKKRRNLSDDNSKDSERRSDEKEDDNEERMRKTIDDINRVLMGIDDVNNKDASQNSYQENKNEGVCDARKRLKMAISGEKEEPVIVLFPKRGPRNIITPESLRLKIEVLQENPKREGSISYQRYEKYKAASTKAEYFKLGGSKGDYAHDLRHGFIIELNNAVVSEVNYQIKPSADSSLLESFVGGN